MWWRWSSRFWIDHREHLHRLAGLLCGRISFSAPLKGLKGQVGAPVLCFQCFVALCASRVKRRRARCKPLFLGNRGLPATIARELSVFHGVESAGAPRTHGRCCECLLSLVVLDPRALGTSPKCRALGSPVRDMQGYQFEIGTTGRPPQPIVFPLAWGRPGLSISPSVEKWYVRCMAERVRQVGVQPCRGP